LYLWLRGRLGQSETATAPSRKSAIDGRDVPAKVGSDGSDIRKFKRSPFSIGSSSIPATAKQYRGALLLSAYTHGWVTPQVGVTFTGYEIAPVLAGPIKRTSLPITIVPASS
jgi:hypothetical protein